jgi:hypothetical protein
LAGAAAFGLVTRLADGELAVVTTSAVVAAAPALAVFTSVDFFADFEAAAAGFDVRVEESGVRRLAM